MSYVKRAGDPLTWIKKAELIEGATYRGKCRNAAHATWKQGKFHYMRHKFGFSYIEEIEHPEDDHGYDVFFPFEKIDNPIDIP